VSSKQPEQSCDVRSTHLFADNQLVRGSYYGQLRLPDSRLVNTRSTSPRGVRSTLVRVRSRSQVRLLSVVVMRRPTYLLIEYSSNTRGPNTKRHSGRNLLQVSYAALRYVLPVLWMTSLFVQWASRLHVASYRRAGSSITAALCFWLAPLLRCIGCFLS